MILPVLFCLLCATITESLEVGETCRLRNGGPGVCVPLLKCSIAIEQLNAGQDPDTICKYDASHNPVICCPTEPTTTTTPSRPNVEIGMRFDGRGEIARQKCAEYAKSVWTWKWGLGGEKVNISECGFKTIPLVVGGEMANAKEFPHMVAIGYNSGKSVSWLCGGTLISEKYVLSAAHCTYSAGVGYAMWARVGDLNLVDSVKDGATPMDRQIIERMKHPNYKPPAEYNDIVLFLLDRPVSFNAWIRPACLHTAPTTDTMNAIATGWGHTEWGEEYGSDTLMKVVLPLISPKTCQDRWDTVQDDTKLPKGINTDTMMCAAAIGKDTCQGDSGGPLVVYSQPEFYCMYNVVGVTSVGKFCGSNFPSVYTRVYHYVPWIESMVWPNA